MCMHMSIYVYVHTYIHICDKCHETDRDASKFFIMDLRRSLVISLCLSLSFDSGIIAPTHASGFQTPIHFFISAILFFIFTPWNIKSKFTFFFSQENKKEAILRKGELILDFFIFYSYFVELYFLYSVCIKNKKNVVILNIF